MKKKRKFLKRILLLLSIVPATVLLYILSALALSLIPVNSSFKQPEQGIDIFVKSNGVHTDIIVPVKTPFMDWTTKIKPEVFKESPTGFSYVAFGWGDKGFYLYTPTWADLKFSTAFKAAFWLSSSAMHVTYYENIPQVNEHTKKIRISEEKYRKLIEHINNSFQKDPNGEYLLIDCCHYNGLNDNFYDGIGIYSFLKTCNSWTNQGLKKSGVKTSLWAPFEWGIMRHLE